MTVGATVTPCSSPVALRDPPLGVIHDGATAQPVMIEDTPCVDFSPMPRLTPPQPRDLCNAAELLERAAQEYETEKANWTPKYKMVPPVEAGCLDARLIHETIQPLEVSRLKSIPDLVHFALNELVWEMAGFDSAAYSRCLLNAAGRSSLMVAPPSHAGWALMPKDSSDDPEQTSSGSAQRVTSTPGNASSGQPSKLDKKRRQRQRRKAERAARTPSIASQQRCTPKEDCDITPSLLMSRVQRLIEWDPPQTPAVQSAVLVAFESLYDQYPQPVQQQEPQVQGQQTVGERPKEAADTLLLESLAQHIADEGSALTPYQLAEARAASMRQPHLGNTDSDSDASDVAAAPHYEYWNARRLYIANSSYPGPVDVGGQVSMVTPSDHPPLPSSTRSQIPGCADGCVRITGQDGRYRLDHDFGCRADETLFDLRTGLPKAGAGIALYRRLGLENEVQRAQNSAARQLARRAQQPPITGELQQQLALYEELGIEVEVHTIPRPDIDAARRRARTSQPRAKSQWAPPTSSVQSPTKRDAQCVDGDEHDTETSGAPPGGQGPGPHTNADPNRGPNKPTWKCEARVSATKFCGRLCTLACGNCHRAMCSPHASQLRPEWCVHCGGEGIPPAPPPQPRYRLECLATGTPEMLTRPCVDCGLITGRFCDWCQAAHRCPDEVWSEGQLTPLCSLCDNYWDECHFCRGLAWCRPAAHR